MGGYIYQSASGQLIYFDGTTKHFFATMEGAQRMASKQEYAQAAQAVTTTLAQVADKMEDMVTVYFDRGYGAGGAKEITDADLAALGITAAELAGFITVAEQVGKLLNNQEVTEGDYDSTLNKLRTDV
jgi:hypothetical protein